MKTFKNKNILLEIITSGKNVAALFHLFLPSLILVSPSCRYVFISLYIFLDFIFMYPDVFIVCGLFEKTVVPSCFTKMQKQKTPKVNNRKISLPQSRLVLLQYKYYYSLCWRINCLICFNNFFCKIFTVYPPGEFPYSILFLNDFETTAFPSIPELIQFGRVQKK